MINFFEKQFDRLAKRIKANLSNLFKRLRAYFKRLLFPLYFFPVKFVTYTTYYLVKFIIKFVFTLISLIFETTIYPFHSLKNFLKSIFILGIFSYIVLSFIVTVDYLRVQYGWWGKFLCGIRVKTSLQNSVVRVVGGYSEGSGFFIAPGLVMTNFHVIATEPSPKIILPDGNFITPLKIIGDKKSDLALLFTENQYDNLVLPLPKKDEKIVLKEGEILLAAGYPLGTVLPGRATVLQGRFIDFRMSKKISVDYIQTDISLIGGMSGGPIVDQCGKVIGINTMGLGGTSLFINASKAKKMIVNFTDKDIKKINVNPANSPEEAIEAFYTYLKTRRMKDGFNLLSKEYLKKTNFEEWTSRFADVLDVDVIKSERYKNTQDTAFVKFSTKNWVDNEVEIHYYEGTWQTIKEDGVYKIFKGSIKEIEKPVWNWFWE